MIASVFILSFIAALMPFEGYEAHAFFIAFILLSSATVAAILEGGKKIKADAVLLTGLAFWGLALISMVLSEIPFVSYIYFCFFSALPLTFLLALYVPRREEFFQYTGLALAAIFAALGVFTFAEYFFLPQWLYKGYACWPLADPNSLASLFSFAFFGSFGLMLAGKDRVQSNAGLVLSLLFFGVILLTGSKGAFLALVAALAIFAVFARAHVIRHKRCCGIFAGAAGLALLVLWMNGAPGFKIATGMGRHGDIGQRVAEITSALQIIRDHLWMGTGIGTFFLYYPQYRGADFNSAGLMAHNDPLQFASEMGILAPFLFYGFIVAAIWRTFRALRNIKPQDVKRIYILAPFCGLGAMVAHAHLNFPFNILPMLMLTGLLTGFWCVQTGVATEKAPAKNSSRRQIAAFGLVMLALVFAALQGGEILTDRAGDRIEAGNLHGFAADINLAGQLSGNTNARALAMAASIPIGVLESRKEKLSRAEIKKLALRAQELLAQSEHFNPRLAAVYMYQAKLAQVAPAVIKGPKPEALLRRALQIDPMHIGARQALAELLAGQGRKKEATAILVAGQDWPNVTTDYLYKMAQLAEEAGDMETHDDALAKMLIANGRQIATITKRSGGLRASGTLR